MYRVLTEQRAARVRPVPRLGAGAGYAIDLGLTRTIARGADLVWLCSPNNPTGLAEPDGRDRRASSAGLLDRCRARRPDRRRSSSSTRPTPSSSGRACCPLRAGVPTPGRRADAEQGLRPGRAPGRVRDRRPTRRSRRWSRTGRRARSRRSRSPSRPRSSLDPAILAGAGRAGRSRARPPRRRRSSGPAGGPDRASRTSCSCAFGSPERCGGGRRGTAPAGPRPADLPGVPPARRPPPADRPLDRRGRPADRRCGRRSKPSSGRPPGDDAGRARPDDGHARDRSPGEPRADDPRDDGRADPRSRRDGDDGRSPPGSASTTTCSARSPITACSTSRSGRPAISRSTSTTRSRTSRSSSGRRSPRRSAIGPGSSGSATPGSRWTSRSPAPSSTSAVGRTPSSTCRSAASGSATLPLQLVEHALEAFARTAGATLHVSGTGRNDHHLAEAAFKALGRALRAACASDPRRTGVASTKGSLG